MASAMVGIGFMLGSHIGLSARISTFRTLNAHLCCSFSLELFRFVIGNQRVDQFSDLTFHKQVQLVSGIANSVIADAVVFEIVGSDFFRTISRPDHRSAFAGYRLMLLLL